MVETRWQWQKRLERWTANEPPISTPRSSRARLGGYELGPDGYMVGRDPRRMSPDELEAMGYQRMSSTTAIRAKCLDCCSGYPQRKAGDILS